MQDIALHFYETPNYVLITLTHTLHIWTVFNTILYALNSSSVPIANHVILSKRDKGLAKNTPMPLCFSVSSVALYCEVFLILLGLHC